MCFFEICGYENSRLFEGKLLDLRSLSSDSSCQLDVLGHNGHPLGVDRAQVGVLEQTDEVRFRGLLKSHDGGRLESQIRLEVLRDLTDKTLEGQLSDEQFRRFLVPADLTKSDGTGLVSVRFLHSSCGWRTLASGLGSQLLSRGLATGRFACGLLGTSHFVDFLNLVDVLRDLMLVSNLALSFPHLHIICLV